ncbi:MAG: hypothetical protein RIS47_2022 [Bacteroidota bacterium]|jgi:dipeptidyl aminopeptidase/acylaminoacyl peptidase
MKYLSYCTVAIIALLFACKMPDKQTVASDKPATPLAEIVPDSVVVHNQRLNPELLWALGRISDFTVSPNGKQVLYGISYYSVSANKSSRDLYLYDLNKNTTHRIAQTPYKEFNETWRPDGKKIGFLAKKDSTVQMFEMNPDGSQLTLIKGIPDGCTGFIYAPKGSKIANTADVKLAETTADRYKDLPQASGRVIDDLMYRHWDEWEDDKFSHIFVADYNAQTQTATSPTDIMPREKWDAPMHPFDGMEEITFSPDDKNLAYSCKKLTGKQAAFSTNSEIYLYNIPSKKTTVLSAGQMGYDRQASFSPDGKYIAWTSMQRNGFEADKNRILLYQIDSAKTKDLTADFDQSSSNIRWSNQSDSLYFISGIYATQQIFSLDLKTGSIAQVSEGDYDYTQVYPANGGLVGLRMSMSAPSDLQFLSPQARSVRQLTHQNDTQLKRVKLGKVEKRWINTTDGKRMLTWIIYPPDFDPTKKYPTLLYCQGGPQSAVSQFWSYRWNFQIMAANDYIIVAPNRRGLPTFGQEWNDQISKEYGGQNIRDYLSAIDEMAKEPYVDATRLGAVGASYGGYSVYYLAGMHKHRFKTFVAHAGIFNFEAMYGTTEESFFVDWDLGGPYWQPQARNSYAASPHLKVANWDTPILVIHGERDYRVPIGQGMSAFNAAQMRGVKSRFLYFPDENHWVLQPQNGILWQREYFHWLKETL